MSEVKEKATVKSETLGLDANAKARIANIKTVAVIGAGTMGNGITHVFAQMGCNVHMVDISKEALDKAVAKIAANMDRQVAKNLLSEETKQAALGHIKTYTDMAEAVADADLVVEAASENIDLKIKIFQELDRLCPAKTILASNTSSISITRIASHTKRPTKVIGMHFMNPVPVMRMVEIINGYATEAEVTQTVYDLTKALGKVPCVVNDYPGFISNRILMPMINEAILCLQEGVAGVEEIDTIMKLGMAHPMGPLQLADFIGLDTCLSILNVLHAGFGNPKYAPATLLCNMVQAGYLGAKSGEGFYKYTPGSKELIVSERFASKQWKM
jgi:3-hydroxybutyryl-CoA dehydrogenase